MGIWRPEDLTFQNLAPERQANIDVVTTAYASMMGDKGYVSMPITSGKRYYDVLKRYKVQSAEELQKKNPDALREEIILPNISDGLEMANRLAPEIDTTLVVPGVFEGRQQRWTQDEYMVLWLRLLTSSVTEVYMTEGWAYSNGGVMEFERAALIKYGCVDDCPRRIEIFDHLGQPLDTASAAWLIAEAIKELRKENFPSIVLENGLSTIAGLAAMLQDPFTSGEEWRHIIHGKPFDGHAVMNAARAVDVPMQFKRV